MVRGRLSKVFINYTNELQTWLPLLRVDDGTRKVFLLGEHWFKGIFIREVAGAAQEQATAVLPALPGHQVPPVVRRVKSSSLDIRVEYDVIQDTLWVILKLSWLREKNQLAAAQLIAMNLSERRGKFHLLLSLR